MAGETPEMILEQNKAADVKAIPIDQILEPDYTVTHASFSMLCRVEVRICAAAETIWDLLTDAKDFPQWNSTVTNIEGEIREGARLQLRVPGTDRIFKPKVSNVITNQRMTWSGGFWPMFKGVRNFELRRQTDHSTIFCMEERFSGLMLPMLKGKLPDFRPVFEAYASDLKREAERMDALPNPAARV